jgi:hypothetical protein
MVLDFRSCEVLQIGGPNPLCFLSSRTHASPNQEHSSGLSRARAEGASCGGASPTVSLLIVNDLFLVVFGLVKGIQDLLASSSFCICEDLEVRWGM